MLKLFEVNGFKNFPHTFSIDFSDVRDYRFNENCIKGDMLKDIIIYGKNSTGKSNFGLAVFDIVAHLTANNVSPGLYDNYINIANGKGEAAFHYVFQFGTDIIDYTYEKSSNKALTFEMLTLNGALIMQKDYGSSEQDLSGLTKLAPTLNYAFNTDGSLLKYALNNIALESKHPLYKMMVFVSKMLWFRNLDQNRYIGYKSSAEDYLTFMLEDATILDEFQHLLKLAGVDDTIYVGTDSDGKKRLYSAPSYDVLGRIPFFSSASSGTKALYAFFYWYKTAPDTSLMFIDEFDAYYHYELSETIVKLLGDMPNTQVILTSHNTNLLSNRIMRPDCYFILTRDSLTSFANATDRELREGHNLEKLYMSGEFYG